MNITEEQIKRFLQDKCSAGEAEAVIAWLNEHPNIAEKYINEKNQDDYGSSERLHPAISQKMFSVIRESAFPESKRIKWLRYVAAAAVLVGVAFGIRYLFNKNNTLNTTTVVQVEGNIATPLLKVVKNNTKDPENIILQDGSVVKLEANSELSYYEPFETNSRRFYLKGEALFKVAKDASRPFTVYSHAVSTTALGTEFKVVDAELSEMIMVKLYEGKVVIKSTDSSNQIKNKDVYLLPGDEYYYNRVTMVAKVTSTNKTKTAITDNTKRVDQSGTSNWYMFNNQRLPQVLDQLAEIYNVKIMYSAAEINKMNFIGKIDKTDSLEHILNDIALLNNLLVTKEGATYSIKKR